MVKVLGLVGDRQWSGPFPVALERVAAGFPSPAQDYYDGPITLPAELIRDEAATFIVRVSGDSMTGAGISDGDELLVDRSIRPEDGDIVIAVLDGEMTVKRLRLTSRGVLLAAENPDYPDLPVGELADLTIWGTVTFCIHHLYRGFRRAG